MREQKLCPNCGNDLWWEEADVGVGVITGPAYCDNPACGYSEESLELCEPDGRVPSSKVPKAGEWHEAMSAIPLPEEPLKDPGS